MNAYEIAKLARCLDEDEQIELSHQFLIASRLLSEMHEEIKRTVDTSVEFDGAISTVMNADKYRRLNAFCSEMGLK